MRRLWEWYDGWRYRRWLRSPDGQRYVAVMGYLAEHGSYTTLHELSPNAYAGWGP